MVLDAVTKDRLRQQIEFYFSDSNLPRDKFLQEQVAANADGYVDVALLCIFQRVRNLLKSTVIDAAKVSEETVVDVADALEGSDSLALSEDRKRVRRTTALKDTDEVAREVDERSLYASPFPFDAGLDSLADFFRQHGDVKCVRMRRHLASKDFKGSVFVEFASKAEAEKVCGLELVFEGAPLTMQPKPAYVQHKEEERKARPAAQQDGGAAPAAAGQKRRAEGEAGAEDGGADGEAGAEAEEAGAEAEGEVDLGDFERGCVVHFDFGAEAAFADAPSYDLIKDSFGGRDEGVLFVDYQRGDKSGAVRFTSPAQAQAAVGKVEDGKFMLAGYAAALRVLEGEEEEAFLKKAAQRRAEADKRRRAEGGGGGRGGRGGGRGRGRGRGRGGRGFKRGRH